MERARPGVKRLGEFQLVVHRGDGLVCRAQVLLAGGPGAGAGRGRQGRGECGGAGKPREGAAQPLAVRRVAAVHQQAQPHQVAGQARGDDDGAQVVAGLGAPAGKGLFLPDPLPLAGQQVQPHVARVPRQGVAGAGQLAGTVVEDRAAGELRQPLCRGGQPVRHGDGAARVEPELRDQPGAQASDHDPVPGGAAGFPGRGERYRVAAEGARQASCEHGGGRRGMADGVTVAEEHLQARTPVVVG